MICNCHVNENNFSVIVDINDIYDNILLGSHVLYLEIYKKTTVWLLLPRNDRSHKDSQSQLSQASH